LKKFGNNLILDNITIKIKPHNVVILEGHNGSGKSTLISILLSTTLPDFGTIKYFGKDFCKHREECLEQIGFASLNYRMPANLYVKENLIIYGQLYGLKKNYINEQILHWLDYFDMADLYTKKSGTLSSGQNAITQLIKAIMHQPKLLILDEITAPLDQHKIEKVYSLFKKLLDDKKTTILMTTHNKNIINNLATDIYDLKTGEYKK